MKHVYLTIATFFYTGYFPKGSGTFATACFVPFYFFIFRDMNPYLYAGITIALYFIGIWASNYAEAILKKEDPSEVVIDEVVGFLITMFLVPFSVKALAIGFVVCRVLDIIKIFPAYQAQSFRGGNGIMADDAISGVQGWIIMMALVYFKVI